MFSLGLLVVQVQSDQEKQPFAFENCKTLSRFEDLFRRLPVFTGCSELSLKMRSFQSYPQTRWFAVFPSQLKQLKRRRSRHEWAENPLSAYPLLSIETHRRQIYVLEDCHYPRLSSSCCQICFTCLSFTKSFFLATFFFNRHARPCVRRVVVENRAFTIVSNERSPHGGFCTSDGLSNRSTNNTRLRWEGKFLASEFVHACM